MNTILEVNNVNKTYRSGDRDLKVLKDINLSVANGERVAIVGPSGSGKTTLLGLCAGLDAPTSGALKLCGEDMNNLSENEKARLRNQNVGFVFQNFQLIPTLTALENVMIPLELLRQTDAYSTAKNLLERVGLAKRVSHYPSQLSGGEQQRVSIARAFCNSPKVLFADEPTGNLDDETGIYIEELLFDMNEEKGTTLVVVTHDMELAHKTGRIIRLKGGLIVSDGHSTSNSAVEV
jgi:putative ABC transport system ATP-binding protein